MPMTKQQAYHQWLSNCPVDINFCFSIPSESGKENCRDEWIIFRDIPKTELRIIKGSKK